MHYIRLITISILITCLNSCVYFWDDPLFVKPLIKDFSLSGKKYNVSLYKTNSPNKYGGLVLIESEVTSAGFNNDFIIAKQMLYNPKVKAFYFIIDTRGYDVSESYEVLKFSSRKEFEKKRNLLNIPISVQLTDIYKLK